MSKLLILPIVALALTACHREIAPLPDDPRFAPVIPRESSIPKPMNGSLYVAGNSLSLFEDMKAHRVGDVITVKLVEKTNASKDAKTNFKKEYSAETPLSTVLNSVPKFKLPIMSDKMRSFLTEIDNKGEFKGSGDSSQNNSLTGELTVTVAQILPNKNLFVKGEKWITLNKGSEFIRISGIVDPKDINTDNIVESTRIADARFTYSGTGDISNSNQPGWISKFFNSKYWPF